MDGATTPEEVHRESDGELVGYVSHEVRDGASIWVARTLFGAVQVRFGYDPDPANVAVLRGAQLDRLSLRIPPARR
ncbi:MAG TPA: hypothetical protein VGL39_05805 [Jatrophihabitantaceae bacterium]